MTLSTTFYILILIYSETEIKYVIKCFDNSQKGRKKKLFCIYFFAHANNNHHSSYYIRMRRMRTI